MELELNKEYYHPRHQKYYTVIFKYNDWYMFKCTDLQTDRELNPVMLGAGNFDHKGFYANLVEVEGTIEESMKAKRIRELESEIKECEILQIAVEGKLASAMLELEAVKSGNVEVNL